MRNRDKKAREIQKSINTVLHTHWDPIGFETPQDEYEGYVGGVYRLLISGANEQEIAEHLANVQSTEIGIPGTAEQLRGVARRLLALDVKLRSMGGNLTSGSS